MIFTSFARATPLCNMFLTIFFWGGGVPEAFLKEWSWIYPQPSCPRGDGDDCISGWAGKTWWGPGAGSEEIGRLILTRGGAPGGPGGTHVGDLGQAHVWR